MLIYIGIEEIVEEFRIPWKLDLIRSISIDYATNSIHGWFENKDVIIFRFKNYGFINDNRSNTYNISSGSAGITIKIETT